MNDKNGVLTLGISALDTISFNLNRVPHVLVAGETGSGKSVILRCLLWQMIEQGDRVYMIDFNNMERLLRKENVHFRFWICW